MKPEQYNPKAREAFGKSLIDIGVAIFKSIILLITVVPISVIFKGAIEGNESKSSVFEILNSISDTTLISIVILVFAAFLIGHYFRKKGLRHIHETEEKT